MRDCISALTSTSDRVLRTKSRLVSTLLLVRHSSMSSTEQPSISHAYFIPADLETENLISNFRYNTIKHRTSTGMYLNKLV